MSTQNEYRKQLDAEFKKLEQLICWHEYYKSVDNPIEANKVQKEIEAQKRTLKAMRNEAP
jgi:hypothetical protein